MYMVDVGFVKRSNCFTKKCYKENANNNNNNKEDIYALHCVNKKYHKRYGNKCSRMNIMFEVDDNNRHSNSSNDMCLSFPLYYDSEIFSKVPFDKMIIPLTTDDDVMSDIEIIEKARCLLHKELHYAIVTKQHYNNNHHHTYKV